MIRRPPRSTQSRSSAASDVYKRQVLNKNSYVLKGKNCSELEVLHVIVPIQSKLCYEERDI